eukprot:GDKH01008725.1.p1 GENE.GDKH01008725.1~~GDKH01008725.1.p1  ORF type:complete len:377 (-),score=70.43 GDKH01008725.1:137-1267(-)
MAEQRERQTARVAPYAKNPDDIKAEDKKAEVAVASASNEDGTKDATGGEVPQGQDALKCWYDYYIQCGYDEETARNCVYGDPTAQRTSTYVHKSELDVIPLVETKISSKELISRLEMSNMDELKRLFTTHAKFLIEHPATGITALKRFSLVLCRDKGRDFEDGGACYFAGEALKELPSGKEVLDAILKQLNDNPSKINCTALSEITWALAKMRMKDLEIYRKLGREVSSKNRSRRYSCRELLNMCWGFVKALAMNSEKGGIGMTTDDYALFDFLAEELKNRELSELHPPELTDLMQSLSQLGYRDIPLFSAVGVQVLKKQRDFTPRQWALCVGAFTKFGIPLRDECAPLKRPRMQRDWERPPPPSKPKPFTQCGDS